MALDAELLISPELDNAALVRVMTRIDRAMKIAAKRTGKEFERQVAEGIRKGIIKGSLGGVTVPVHTAGVGKGAAGAPGAPKPPRTPTTDTEAPKPPRTPKPTPTPDAGLHGAMMTAPESAAAFRARLRREAAAEQRAAERVSRMDAERWTIGGVGRRVKGSIKGANIFRAGGLGLGIAGLLAPTAITGAAGLWGMMRAGGIRDSVQKAIDEVLKENPARHRMNMAGLAGMDVASVIALERQGLNAGMKQGSLSALASGIFQGIATGDKFFSNYKGMARAQVIPTALANLANASSEDRLGFMSQLGIDLASGEKFFADLQKRGTGAGGKVTLDDIKKASEEDQRRAKGEAERAEQVAQMQHKALVTMETNSNSLIAQLGKGSTFDTYIENVNQEHAELMRNLKNFGTASDVANQLTALIQSLDATTLAIAKEMMPGLKTLVDTLNGIFGGAKKAHDFLFKPVEESIPEGVNAVANQLGYTGDFIEDMKGFLDSWKATADANAAATRQKVGIPGYTPPAVDHSTGYGRSMGIDK